MDRISKVCHCHILNTWADYKRLTSPHLNTWTEYQRLTLFHLNTWKEYQRLTSPNLNTWTEYQRFAIVTSKYVERLLKVSIDTS